MPDDGLQLARLDMGSVVSQTFAIIGRNMLSIGTVALIVTVADAIIAFGAALIPPNPGAAPRLLLLTVPAVVAMVMQVVAIGGIIRIAVSDLDGTPIGIGAALLTGARLLLPLLGLYIVVGFGVGFATLLLIVPGVWLALRWLVCAPVLVAEGTTIGRALSRSDVLTRGNLWRLLGLVVVFSLLSACLNSGIFYGLRQMGTIIPPVAAGAIRIILSTITTAISVTGVAACYIELSRAGEGTSFRDRPAVFA